MCGIVYTTQDFGIIGVSRSEPHTNQFYKKIAVLMYVCMYVCMYVAIRRPRVHHMRNIVYSSRARAVNIAALTPVHNKVTEAVEVNAGTP